MRPRSVNPNDPTPARVSEEMTPMSESRTPNSEAGAAGSG